MSFRLVWAWAPLQCRCSLQWKRPSSLWVSLAVWVLIQHCRWKEASGRWILAERWGVWFPMLPNPPLHLRLAFVAISGGRVESSAWKQKWYQEWETGQLVWWPRTPTSLASLLLDRRSALCIIEHNPEDRCQVIQRSNGHRVRLSYSQNTKTTRASIARPWLQALHILGIDMHSSTRLDLQDPRMNRSMMVADL